MTLQSLPKYATYKDSGVEWLGKIPAHWNIIQLKRLLSFHTGGTPSSGNQSFYDGELPWVTIADLNGKYTNKFHQISKKGVQQARIPLTVKGSLLYSFKLSIGQVSFASRSIYTNEAIASFPPKEKVNLDYYYYALPIFLERNASVNIYGAKLLNQDLIKNSLVIALNSEEQTAIASFLDQKTAQIDAAIAIKEQQIALLKERKQILIQQAVTQGLDPTVPMKDSGVEWIGQIPVHWHKTQVRRVLKNIEQGNSPSLNNEVKCDSYAVLKISAVKKGFFFAEEKKPILRNQFIDAYSAKNGDFLLTRGNTPELVADSCIVSGLEDEKIMISDLIYRLSFEERKVNKRYLLNFFQSSIMRKQIRDVARGSSSTMVKVSQEHIKSWTILMPPNEEQCQISDFILRKSIKIDHVVSVQQQQIEKLREYKTTLINSAVTGKIRVTPEMVAV